MASISFRSPFCFQCIRCSSDSITPSNPQTLQSPVSLVLLTECQFSSAQITKIMHTRKSLLKTRSPNTAREAVHFLKQCGFTQPQLYTAIVKNPSILALKVDTQLNPKFHYFRTLGFTDEELNDIISSCPRLLGLNLEGNIIPKVSFLETVLGAKLNLVKALKRSPRFLSESLEKELKPKFDLLKQWGVQGESLSLLLSINPRGLASCSYEDLRAGMEYARNRMGIVQDSKRFIYGISVLICNRPQAVEMKMKHLQCLGLSEDEVRELLIKRPWLFASSTNKIQENMDFFTQTVGLKPKILISHPRLFHYSVKKRLIPRYAVFKALLSWEQQPGCSLITIFHLTERRFLANIVECNPQASKLKEIYYSKIDSAAIEIQEAGHHQTSDRL